MLQEIQLPEILKAIPGLHNLNVAPNSPKEFVQCITRMYVNSYFRPDGENVRSVLFELLEELQK